MHAGELLLSGWQVSYIFLSVTSSVAGRRTAYSISTVCCIIYRSSASQWRNVRGSPWLQSTSTGCIQLARVQTTLTGWQSFVICHLKIWNILPLAVHNSIMSRKCKRETHVSLDSDKHCPTPLWYFCDFDPTVHVPRCITGLTASKYHSVAGWCFLLSLYMC